MNLASSRVLVLEDEPLLRRRLCAHLEKLGADVTAVGLLAEARRVLADMSFDFALLDVNLPDGRSLALLSDGVLTDATITIAMTAEGGVAGAVEAIRLGAADYFVKPFDLDELLVRLSRSKRDRQVRRGNQFQRRQESAGIDAFVFDDALAPLRTQLEKIVAADQRVQGVPPSVLIEGETGTGKTTLARWIHRHGPRANAPLIEVNCAALPDMLVESELFGHERGAFTDARDARMGLLEAAEGGTLFLDELPSLAPAVQAKLLKAIEDGSVRRVGSNRALPIDARIIAATNRDLRALVSAGEFREDLMHRLDLFRVRIPPLRERGDTSVLTLAEALVARVARRYGLPIRPIPAAGRARLLAHRWPGNVRELAHEIERSLVFEDDQLAFESLARPAASTGEAGASNGWLNPHFRFPPEGGFQLEAAIDELVARALQQSEENVTAAARLLGVSRDVVRYRLKQSNPAGK